MKKNISHCSLAQMFALSLCAVLVISAAPQVTKAKPAPRIGAQSSPPSLGDTVRLLEQSTFGPTPELISYVQNIGIEAFLEEQFNAPMSSYPTLDQWPTTRPTACTGPCQRDNYTMYPLQRRFFENALYGPDQLRQRVAFGLHQIFVVSGRDIQQPSWMAPYLQVLDRNAFGNFRQLLEEITLNTAMGYYLDMRRSTRTSPNENFAREILQLFSIGLFELNQDGTLVLDEVGNPIPTYDQATINEFAKALTGWYEPAQIMVSYPPILPNSVVAPDYVSPMRVWNPEATYHDRGEKRLLNGVVLPAGQSTRQDLTDVLDNIFYHQNVGPYIGKQLIQRLVTSNPSPEYVGRVSAIFNDNGEGVRGDLRAVVKAILLDPEARGDAKTESNYGRLREPVQLITNILRAFNATSDGVIAGNTQQNGTVTNYVGGLGQDVLRPPTVFSYYPFDNEVPGTEPRLLGPEFGLLSTATTLARANFVNTIVFQGIPSLRGSGTEDSPDRPIGTRLDLSAMEGTAGDPEQLVEALNTLLMHGTMSGEMRSIIVNAVSVIPESNPSLRVRQAVYLVASSAQYQVER